MQLSIRAYAKINLFLNVVEKRSDGFHDLESLFQSISLFDTLYVQGSKNFCLDLDETSSVLPKSRLAFLETNLIKKVWEHCAKHYGIPPINIRLTKRIPIGSGLGGGSANAAAMLLAINEVFRLGMTASELQKLAERFGSDVPFFVHGGLAKVEGKGDLLSPIEPVLNVCFVVVYPGVHISTEEAYNGMVVLGRPKRLEDFLGCWRGQSEGWLKQCNERSHNAFQRAICERHPSVQQALGELKARTPFASMSGTGSSVFGVFGDEEEATRAFEALRGTYQTTYLLRPVPKGVEVEAG